MAYRKSESWLHTVLHGLLVREVRSKLLPLPDMHRQGEQMLTSTPCARADLTVLSRVEVLVAHIRGVAHAMLSHMPEQTRERILERLELSASISWLFMDFAWMEESVTVAVTCAVPASLCSIFAIGFVRRDATARAVVAAMAAWAVMNSFWMMSDLKVYDGLWVARSCFGLSLVLLAFALIVSGSLRAVLHELASAFRRLRSRTSSGQS